MSDVRRPPSVPTSLFFASRVFKFEAKVVSKFQLCLCAPFEGWGCRSAPSHMTVDWVAFAYLAKLRLRSLASARTRLKGGISAWLPRRGLFTSPHCCCTSALLNIGMRLVKPGGQFVSMARDLNNLGGRELFCCTLVARAQASQLRVCRVHDWGHGAMSCTSPRSNSLTSHPADLQSRSFGFACHVYM